MDEVSISPPGGGARGFILRYLTAALKSLTLILRSLGFWPFATWLRIWTTRAPESRVEVGGASFFIRSRRLHVKLTDLYMIVSCVLDEQYTRHEGFALSPEDVVLDIGGHIGSFSVYAGSRVPRGRVVVYEPDLGSHTLLLKNVAANGLSNVTAHRKAVGAKAGERTLYSAPLNSAENSFYWGGIHAQSVPGVTLEQVFEENGIERCDLMKLDCEGAEYEILLNAPSELLRRVRRICIEVHVGRYFGLTDPRAVPETVIALLRESGFELRIWEENELHTFVWARRP